MDSNRKGYQTQDSYNSAYKDYLNILSNRQLTIDKDLFDKGLTKNIIDEYVNKHRELIPFYESMRDMYTGAHPIYFQNSKGKGKPDHRSVSNFAKYIVDTANAYITGLSPVFDSEDTSVRDFVNNFRKDNDEDDLDSELTKNILIFGHAYKYLYQGEDSKTKVAVVDPTNAFIVYSDDVRRIPLFAVVYEHIDDKTFKCGVYDYSNNGKLIFTQDVNSKDNSRLEPAISSGEILNPYEGLPLIEFKANEERQGRIEGVTSLINAYNSALSDEANDVSYFADALLKVIGINIDQSLLDNMRDKRMLFSPTPLKNDEQVDVDFISKPSSNETQENLLDRLERLIYKHGMIFNNDDKNFSGNVSGEALKIKLRDMNSASNQLARKLERSYREEYKKVMAIPTNGISDKAEDWKTITYKPTLDIPHNLSDEVDTASKAQGILSQRTILANVSSVQDVDTEIKLLDEEKKENEPTDTLSDFQKPEEDVDIQGQMKPEDKEEAPTN